MTESEVKRIDGLEHYYRPIEKIEVVLSALFWASAALSVAVLYSRHIPWQSMQDVPMLLFAGCVVVHLLLALYLKFHLIPIAEERRRKQLLTNSFDVPLTPEQTQAYYNNPLAPSIRRLGANVLENSFFAKAVCGKMAARERAKVLIYFIVWILAALWRGTPLDILVVVTQTVFSGEILARLVSIEVLRHRNEALFEELYHEFLHKVDFRSSTGTACILDAFATYEAAKASAALKQSTRIFTALNPDLTRQWKEITEQLGMDEESPNKTTGGDA
jgi:hypothetical protein